MRDEAERAHRRRLGRPAYYGVALFSVLAAVALLQGQAIESISLDPGSGEVKVGFAAGAQTDELQGNQAQLAARSDVMAQQLAQQAPPAQPQTPAIAGNWFTPTGFTYQIQQYGTGILVRESSAFGVTGVGQGQLHGDTARISYQAADGSYGQGTLYVHPGAQRIDATFHNALSGQSSTVAMTRGA